MVRLLRHPQTKGRDTDRPSLNHRATSRLYPKNGTASDGWQDSAGSSSAGQFLGRTGIRGFCEMRLREIFGTLGCRAP